MLITVMIEAALMNFFLQRCPAVCCELRTAAWDVRKGKTTICSPIAIKYTSV